MANVVAITRDRRRDRADDDGETRVFRVQYDAKDFNLTDAKNADDGTTAIPPYYDPLSPGSNIVVTNKTVTSVGESPYIVDVEVKWSVPTTGTFEPQPEGEDNWGFDLAVRGVSVVETTNKDVYGNPMSNSSHEPFPLAVEKESFDEDVIWSFNAISVEGDAIAEARGKINSDTVVLATEGLTRTFPPGTLRLGNVEYSRAANKDGQIFYRVVCPLHYRAETWAQLVVDEGFHTLNDDLEWEPIPDAKGDPKSTSTYLDGTGQVADPGSEAVLLEFDIYEEADFNVFLGNV